MKKETKFWIFLILYTAALLFLSKIIWEDMSPKFIRADDGTPCYVYRDSLDCDLDRRSSETKSSEYPYAVKP